jgi:uracil-DNA glycosylase
MVERSQIDCDKAAEALRSLAESLRDCKGCVLTGGRTQVVFGVGNPCAEVMFVGEGPGFNEDRQGEPFVGAAGKLLTELLGQIGLKRSDVYIANVVKCRPPENRDPLPDEIEACSPHLLEQIAVIRPKVICTLGRFATKLLAETALSMTAIHGRAKQRTIAGVDLVVFPVFHPAAALYTPANRKVLEEDFIKLRHLLAHGLSPRGDVVEASEGGVPRAAVASVPAGSSGAPAPGPPAASGSPAAPGATTAGEAAKSDTAKGAGRPPNRVEQLPLW